MRTLMMTDMEGVAGILNHDDWVMRDGRYHRTHEHVVHARVRRRWDGAKHAD